MPLVEVILTAPVASQKMQVGNPRLHSLHPNAEGIKYPKKLVATVDQQFESTLIYRRVNVQNSRHPAGEGVIFVKGVGGDGQGNRI